MWGIPSLSIWSWSCLQAPGACQVSLVFLALA